MASTGSKSVLGLRETIPIIPIPHFSQILLFSPRTQLTCIFEGQPFKTMPFPIKTRVIWVLGSHGWLMIPICHRASYKILDDMDPIHNQGFGTGRCRIHIEGHDVNRSDVLKEKTMACFFLGQNQPTTKLIVSNKHLLS